MAAKPLRFVVSELSPRVLKQLGELIGSRQPPTIAAAPTAERFTKVSADGKLLPKSAAKWEGVYEAATGLVWGRKLLPGEFTWKDALKEARRHMLCGEQARAPTVRERFCLSDFERESPALDTNYFDPAETGGWEWTSTAAPSGDAWYVYLGDGYSGRIVQSYRTHVRAVRAGQFSDIGS